MRWVAALLTLSLAFAATAQTRLDVLRGGDETQRFEQALQPRAFVFPADHGPHPGFRHEWWYVTGHLRSARGARFGFELTFFRYALSPLGIQSPGGSAWRTSQIYLAHFAVTDLERHEFHFAERHSREALGLAGASAQPFKVWLEDWSLEGEGDRWSLRAATGRHALQLRLQPLSAPVLNGDRGLSRKSDANGAASYYYSLPRIAVSGQLDRDGKALQVEGTAWLDREWGSGALAVQQKGWDWFALQFDDGSTLMIYELRRRDGQRDPHSAGTWVDPAGRVRHLSANELILETLDHWVSPAGDRYPSRWRLRSAPLALEIVVRPSLANQELLTRPRYWEGAAEVAGTRAGAPVSGRGYVELVGYAARD